MRWSGQAAPTCDSAAESRPRTKAIVAGVMSVDRIFGWTSRRPSSCRASTPATCQLRCPRRAGRISARRSSRASVGMGSRVGPPKVALLAVRPLTKAAAVSIAVIVLRWASSSVSPHVTRPCRARRTNLAAGFARTASPTCRASAKPGRMYGTQIAPSPKQSRASCSPSVAQQIMLIASG